MPDRPGGEVIRATGCRSVTIDSGSPDQAADTGIGLTWPRTFALPPDLAVDAGAGVDLAADLRATPDRAADCRGRR